MQRAVRLRPTHLRLLPLVAAAASCDPGGGIIPAMDASNEASAPPMCPPPPMVDMVPARIPYNVATIKGSAPGARRVLVTSGFNPAASAIRPDNTFCIDLPLPMPQDYEVTVHSQGADGTISCTGTTVRFTQDPSAPRIPGAETCAGSDPAGCAATREMGDTCSNGRDDDCDGVRDAMDPDCATCRDDGLEPNDNVMAPQIEAGTFRDLVLCPNDQDFYGIGVRPGFRVAIRVTYNMAMGDVDAELRGADAAHTTVVGRSVGTTGTETIAYTYPSTQTTAGTLYLRVYCVGHNCTNRYTLTLQITPPTSP